MAPPVITITRQYASGGSDIARLVAVGLCRAGGAGPTAGRPPRVRRRVEAVAYETRRRASRCGPRERREGGGRHRSAARPVRADLLRPPPRRRGELRPGGERRAAGA